MRARSEAISTRSFSARSAAVACSASGRSRLRTSSSTSRARSTCSATRASFSSARWRRRLNLPSPAASSTNSRRSSGFDARTCSTLPCPTIECSALPSPTSERISTRSVRRTDARLTRYWPSEPRTRRRAIDTSEKSRSGHVAVLVVEDELDLAVLRRLTLAATREEDVVGLLGAQLGGRQRSRCPDDRVGDVRLTGAVRADDDGDARLERELERVGKRLEAADAERAQVHRPGFSPSRSGSGFAAEMRSGTTPSASSAWRAASCSAAFFVEPRPMPSCAPATCAAQTKRRSCGGPSTSRTV